MNEQNFKKVVFLDTNVMHYARLCVDHARGQGIQLDLNNGTVSKLKGRISALSEEGLKQSLLRGLESILLLSRDDIQVEYAPLSELELMAGIAKGEALRAVAREGTPYRMWSRFPDQEIRDRITTGELADIRKTVDSLAKALDEMGVPITQSSTRRNSESMDVAKDLAGQIYLTEIDSLIYATALTAGADYLLTADAYLRETVNLIRDSEEERYEKIRNTLKQSVGNLQLTDSADIELPRAFAVRHDGRLQGISISTFP